MECFRPIALGVGTYSQSLTAGLDVLILMLVLVVVVLTAATLVLESVAGLLALEW